MSERTATLTNLDRAEYGTIIVDLDLLSEQLTWLAGIDPCDHRDGILNLLGGIMDLADEPEEPDEDLCHEDTDNIFIVGGAQA